MNILIPLLCRCNRKSRKKKNLEAFGIFESAANFIHWETHLLSSRD